MITHVLDTACAELEFTRQDLKKAARLAKAAGAPAAKVRSIQAAGRAAQQAIRQLRDAIDGTYQVPAWERGR
jgi:uncharacterized protein involved in exopolysaccharide biosynthesis